MQRLGAGFQVRPRPSRYQPRPLDPTWGKVPRLFSTLAPALILSLPTPPPTPTPD